MCAFLALGMSAITFSVANAGVYERPSVFSDYLLGEDLGDGLYSGVELAHGVAVILWEMEPLAYQVIIYYFYT